MGKVLHPLDFERDLVEVEEELEQLKERIANGELELTDEYDKLEAKLQKMKKDTFSKLTPYQRVQLSRHFDRPYTLDYAERIFTDFIELHGDRLFRDDPAIVGGTAKLNGKPVIIVGHQRGRSTEERIHRNFGMAQPEGYRKALRLFRLAEKFSLPLITLIDTQGAYPGIEAEERGQAEAIAKNLIVLADLKVPTISVVIGEGGSGGALALGVTDRILMLENACYSVITPEGCASILWKNESADSMPEYAAMAAEMLKLTSEGLSELNVIDGIVPEPSGGAHRNIKESAENLKSVLVRELAELNKLSMEELLEQRYSKFKSMGVTA